MPSVFPKQRPKAHLSVLELITASGPTLSTAGQTRKTQEKQDLEPEGMGKRADQKLRKRQRLAASTFLQDVTHGPLFTSGGGNGDH